MSTLERWSRIATFALFVIVIGYFIWHVFAFKPAFGIDLSLVLAAIGAAWIAAVLGLVAVVIENKILGDK